MKKVVWIVFAIAALLWTGFMAIAASLTGWAAAALVRSAEGGLPGLPAADSLPAWLAPWIDAAQWADWQAAAAQAVAVAQSAMPFIGSAAGWLEPLVWVLWGLGLLTLLAVAGAGHVAVRLAGQRPATGAPLRAV